MTRKLFPLLMVVLFCISGSDAFAQTTTWETIFKKPEKMYAKGKFGKVDSKLKKLRKKEVTKKYMGDSTLLGLANIMEAKAAEAQANFPEMHSLIESGLGLLEKYKDRNKYAHVMGYLRAIDVYHAYGNHRKADSLVQVMKKWGLGYIQSDLLMAELQIREVLTQIENGYLNEAEKALPEVTSTFQNAMLLTYFGEPMDKRNQVYKQELLAMLYVSPMRVKTEKGLFAEAEAEFKTTLKKINRIVDARSGAYTYLNYQYAKNYYEWGDLRLALKSIEKFNQGAYAPFWFEPLAELEIMANLKMNLAYDANLTVKDHVKLMNKAGLSRDYRRVKEKYMEALIGLYDEEQKQNRPFRKFLTLNSDAVAVQPDMALIAEMMQFSADYAIKTGEYANYVAAEQYLKDLGANLALRYPTQSVQNGLFSAMMAGYYLNYSERPGEAFRYLRSGSHEMPVRQLTSGHPRYQRLVNDLREYYVVTGNYEQPIKMQTEVTDALRTNPNVSNTQIGNSLVALAKLQTLAGYYSEAEINVDEALKLIRRDGERRSQDFVVALNNAAVLYGTIGRFDKAETLLNRSRSISRKLDIKDKQVELAAVEDMAFLYTRLGNYAETERLLKEVIAEKTKVFGDKSHRLIKPHLSIGELYLIKGEYPLAETYLRKALQTTRATYGDTVLLYTDVLSEMVQLYTQLGVYDEALANANEVLKLRIAKYQPNHIKIARTYQSIGNIFFAAGLNLKQAEHYYGKYKEIVSKNFPDSHPLYADALKNIAYLYVAEEKYDSALVLLEQADDIWSKSIGNRNVSSGEVARLKGDIYSYRSDFRNARKEYEKSARYFRRIFNAAHPDYLNTQSRLARANFIEGNLKEVESILTETTDAYLNYTRTYFPTLSEEEKAKFWNKIKGDFEFYNTVGVQLADLKPKYLEKMYDFTLVTKGLLLSSSQKTRRAILSSGDVELVASFEKWLENKEYLTSLLAMSDEDILANEIDVKKLQEETALLEKELSAKSSAFAESFEFELYAWTDVQKVLDPSEAAVEIIRYREFDDRLNEQKVRYAALILTAETRKAPMLVWLENGNDMEGKHFSLQRNGVQYKLQEENSYKQFWQPVYDRISDKKIVYLSPDGIYNQINVESLYTGDGQYVIDRQNVRVVNSTKTLAINRSKQAKKVAKKLSKQDITYTALLVGNPKYYADPTNIDKAKLELKRGGADLFIPQLPGTEAEVKTISQLLTSNNWEIEYLLGSQANEETIKAQRNKTLIHIATHGFFDEKERVSQNKFNLLEQDNPLDRSGLMAKGAGDVLLMSDKNYNVEDGILTATEAMNLNFDNTELVVLSACETGRGKIEQGEGVFGLQRSFLVAGADAIIMSLFKVDDEVTQNLMIEFYKYWLAGDDKRTAFNKAQIGIKDRYKEPIYWGAFTMIGKS